jgi:hypothetical protein
MTAIMTALDNHTPLKLGENGHLEYGWSNNIKEKIVQFSFQLVRTEEDRVAILQNTLVDILTNLKHKATTGSLPEKEAAKEYLSVLYRMIGHTRDIIDGKGECTLSYMMIYTWHTFFPELSFFALRCLVELGDNDKKIHQYGSWKDLKYLCKYCVSQGEKNSHPLIKYSIKLMNEQLRKDTLETDISLVAKWIPRENSSFGWLYEDLACDYFQEYLTTTNHNNTRTAILKCKTNYRKIVSALNKQIDTLQIKQCGADWSSVDFNKVTSISLSKQKKAFLNINKNGTVRNDSEDRITCAENFKDHIQRAVKGEIEVKGKRIGMNTFTNQALQLLENPNCLETELLNSQWRDNSTQNGSLGKMIAMVDVSGSMSGEPLETAIALGIRIAEKSIVGKRVMTFSSSPTWVNLEAYPDFCSQVEVLSRAEWGMTTNFYAALNLILDAIVQNKLSPNDVEDMVLVILSDMQMNSGDSCNKQTLYDTMKTKYADAGIKVHGKPYNPPHILFWNLRSTDGFPSLSNQPNCSMMSGFSPALLNLFCDKGLEALNSCTPWSVLQTSLENDRYKIMGDKFTQVMIDF